MHTVQLAAYCTGSHLYKHIFSQMAKKGVRQTIASPYGAASNFPELENCRWIDKKIWNFRHRVNFNAKKNIYVRTLETDGVLNESVTLVHAHTLYTDGFAARQIALRREVPYIVTVRATDVAIFAKFFPHLRAEARRVIEDSSKVIFVNYPYIRQLETTLKIKIDPGKVSVVPNGIDESWFCEDTRPSSFLLSRAKNDHVQLISVGSIDRRKNQLALINSILKYNLKNRSVHLTIVGDVNTTYASRLRRKFESEQVRFLGKLSIDELKEEFLRHDVFALVSRLETFGMVYAEALSQGLPVIYTQGQGFDGWHTDDDIGRACKLNEISTIGKVANELANVQSVDAITRRKLLAEKFRWPDLANDLYEIYKSAAK